MISLNVELHGELIGRLVGDGKRKFDFVVEPHAVESHGLGSHILSLSVPLLLNQPAAKASRRRNFFAELLPEGDNLANLAAAIRVTTDDVPQLLAQYGRDVAGAVQIYDPLIPGEPKTPALLAVSGFEVAELLRNAQREPLGNSPRRGRTSLAGVQDKIVLAANSAGWNRVVDGYPSTHILKPVTRQYPTMIYDEEYGQRICRLLGLANFGVEIESFDGQEALVIERFDRTADDSPKRIHQEDMNQALGASKNEKYQEFGGKVSLKRISEVLAASATGDSLERLLKQLTVALAIGNLDMHAKNLSIFHFGDGSFDLTPAYDMVPQMHLDADGKMALAINGKYHHAQINGTDLAIEGDSWGIQNADEIVRTTLGNVLEVVANEQTHPNAYPQLRADIEAFTNRLISS